MPSVVADASAIAAVLFGEPSADEVVERLGSARLAAPSLLPYEIVSVAGGKVRRGEVPTDTAMTALSVFARMRILLHELDFSEVFRLTVRTRLTAYDAAYLHLAQSLSADLVTLDDKLARVWSRLQGERERPAGRSHA